MPYSLTNYLRLLTPPHRSARRRGVVTGAATDARTGVAVAPLAVTALSPGTKASSGAIQVGMVLGAGVTGIKSAPGASVVPVAITAKSPGTKGGLGTPQAQLAITASAVGAKTGTVGNVEARFAIVASVVGTKDVTGTVVASFGIAVGATEAAPVAEPAGALLRYGQTVIDRDKRDEPEEEWIVKQQRREDEEILLLV